VPSAKTLTSPASATLRGRNRPKDLLVDQAAPRSQGSHFKGRRLPKARKAAAPPYLRHKRYQEDRLKRLADKSVFHPRQVISLCADFSSGSLARRFPAPRRTDGRRPERQATGEARPSPPAAGSSSGGRFSWPPLFSWQDPKKKEKPPRRQGHLEVERSWESLVPCFDPTQWRSAPLTPEFDRRF